jgi:hypothetical protein
VLVTDFFGGVAHVEVGELSQQLDLPIHLPDIQNQAMQSGVNDVVSHEVIKPHISVSNTEKQLIQRDTYWQVMRTYLASTLLVGLILVSILLK